MVMMGVFVHLVHMGQVALRVPWVSIKMKKVCPFATVVLQVTSPRVLVTQDARYALQVNTRVRTNKEVASYVHRGNITREVVIQVVLVVNRVVTRVRKDKHPVLYVQQGSTVLEVQVVPVVNRGSTKTSKDQPRARTVYGGGTVHRILQRQAPHAQNVRRGHTTVEMDEPPRVHGALLGESVNPLV